MCGVLKGFQALAQVLLRSEAGELTRRKKDLSKQRNVCTTASTLQDFFCNTRDAVRATAFVISYVSRAARAAS